MRPRTSFAVTAALSVFGAHVMACSPPVENRTYAQRLSAEPVSFIGTVTSVADRGVTFAVHHVMSGPATSAQVIEAAEPSTCAISFAVGQRWLYAGNLTVSPSVLLVERAAVLPASDLGRLRRVVDEQLRMPSRWQACASNSQCVTIPVGCDLTASNLEHAAQARAHSIKVAGNPQTLQCAFEADVQQLGSPQCIRSKCGQWVVDSRVRP